MDLDKLIEDIKKCNGISEHDLIALFHMSEDIFFQEGTLLILSAPISICGDVHGQFHDVLKLFEIGGQPSETKYLFLGDYVDRGLHSVETLALLLAYKIKYPDRFFLLRGNHESRKVNTLYGFYEEIVQRFGHAGPWKLCNEIFDLLPLAALVDDKLYCVHGGLSPQVKLVDQVVLFERRKEIPEKICAVSDICWSDPQEDMEEWGPNPRGAGHLFGRRPVKEFCFNNNLQCIVRAHQLINDGYQWLFDNKLVTVWSAPNYMYRNNNLASIMEVKSDLTSSFKVFEAVTDNSNFVPEDRIPSYFS